MIDIDQLIETEGLFVTEFPDWSFSWRLLTLREYKVFRGLRDSGTLHDYSVYIEVFKRCYLGESRFLNQRTPVGVYVTVGELIMYLSGDCELDTLKDDIEIARSIYPSDSVNERMKQVIFTAFPGYKIDDVEQWSRPKLLRNFVLSEQVLIQRGMGYEPMDVEEIRHPDDVPDERPASVVDPSKLDFDQDAASDMQKLGMWATEEARDLEAQRSRQLTTEQAKKLDRMTRPRR